MFIRYFYYILAVRRKGDTALPLQPQGIKLKLWKSFLLQNIAIPDISTKTCENVITIRKRHSVVLQKKYIETTNLVAFLKAFNANNQHNYHTAFINFWLLIKMMDSITEFNPQ